MPGVSVAGVTVEMDSAKLRALADRLEMVLPGATAAVDAVGELRRLADGFDLLREAATQEREAAAAMFRRQFAVMCDCESCTRAREAPEEQKPRLNS